MTMDNKQLLSNIRRTEDDAQTLLDDSQAKGQKRLEWAEQEASRILEAAEQDSLKESELKQSGAGQDIDSQAARILEEGRADIQERISASKANHGKAVEFLISGFRKAGSLR